ncbi:membrane protein [Methylosinus sp. C49]|uniref:MgtC/SapB family protein n=1 Tax=Methylosinus sp. C49 TaxID=2699395 RepID=UPI0013675B19|nr:MgtC/SapB family protein [Methylosinus sp. C49]BBU62268.1 membrane protein [Methylosinus sp. C49]
METTELFRRLTVALAIGLLIGLERGWQAREDEEGERAAGFRTHALAALLGAVWGAICNQTGIGGAVSLGLAFMAFAGAIVLFRYREIVHDETFGATTVVAAMLAFALGAFAVVGDVEAAAAAGVVTAGLLALKSASHGWLRRLSWVELRSGLTLAAMTVILLPLLPDRAVDPWKTVNPHEIWLLTVLIAVISFLGYVAMKAAGGAGGVALTGIAGGLVSSTAATMTLARLSREQSEGAPLFAAGALFANATMALRVLAVVALIDIELLGVLAAPFAAGGAVMLAFALLFMRRAVASSTDVSHASKNPLDLGAVLQFGALLTVVAIVARLATRMAGEAGALAVAAISGVVDVDAITLSMARLDRATVSLDAAAASIGLAVAVNTLSKAALTWWIGGAGLGFRVTAASALALACALAVALLAR